MDFTIIDRFLDLKYDSLEQFINDIKELCVLKWNKKDKATCYCRRGFSYGICEHKLGLEMFLKALSVPVRLKPNKRRGRKPKATSALNQESSSIQQRLRSKAKRVKRGERIQY